MDADDEDELADDDDGDELGEEEEEGDYEDDDTAHPFSNLPPSSSTVYTGVIVVSHSGDSGAEIQLGDPVEVICGFRNAGAEALTVTHVLGSLSNPVSCFLQSPRSIFSVWRHYLLSSCVGMYGGLYERWYSKLLSWTQANFFEYVDNFTEVAVNRESDPNTELSLDYR